MEKHTRTQTTHTDKRRQKERETTTNTQTDLLSGPSPNAFALLDKALGFGTRPGTPRQASPLPPQQANDSPRQCAYDTGYQSPRLPPSFVPAPTGLIMSRTRRTQNTLPGTLRPCAVPPAIKARGILTKQRSPAPPAGWPHLQRLPWPLPKRGHLADSAGQPKIRIQILIPSVKKQEKNREREQNTPERNTHNINHSPPEH